MTGSEHDATPGAIDPAALRIESGHLVEVSKQCTCGGGGEFDEHEKYCGVEPLMTVAELATLISPPAPVLTPRGLVKSASDYEVEGMRLVPDDGEPWMTRLSKPLPPVVARAVGALTTAPGVNRLAAVKVAYTLADAGLLTDIEE